MIWFVCKKCSKTHGRSENSIGTMVFCDCGQGNLVPWESTVAEPKQEIPTTVPPPPSTSSVPSFGTASPSLEPIKFEPDTTRDDAPRAGGKRRRIEKRNPAFCFNHQTVPKHTSCVACGESFCESCILSFEGKELCGPCKNFRVRSLQVPPQTTGWATASFLLPIATVPFLLCVGVFGKIPPTNLVFTLALLPLTLASCMGLWAIYLSETKPDAGGFSWALSGIGTSLLTVMLIVMFQQLPLGL